MALRWTDIDIDKLEYYDPPIESGTYTGTIKKVYQREVSEIPYLVFDIACDTYPDEWVEAWYMVDVEEIRGRQRVTKKSFKLLRLLETQGLDIANCLKLDGHRCYFDLSLNKRSKFYNIDIKSIGSKERL